MAAAVFAPASPAASAIGVRQYDHLNQYYCPAVVKDGCAQKLCLRRKDQPAGFVGPASSFVECYDADSGSTSAPVTWNPVYDAASPPPPGAPAADCSQVVQNSAQAHCGWIWGLIVLCILGILVFAGLAWAGKHHHHHRDDAHDHAADVPQRWFGGFGPGAAGAGAVAASGKRGGGCWRW